MTNDITRLQVYRALQTASERIGANNYAAGVAVKGKRYRYSPTLEHRELVDAMPKVLDGRLSPDAAMSLLHQYDTMRQRCA
jgi:hypothetical protein